MHQYQNVLLVQSTRLQAIVGTLTLLIHLCATNTSKSTLKSLHRVKINGVRQNLQLPMVKHPINWLETCGMDVNPHAVAGGALIQTSLLHVKAYFIPIKSYFHQIPLDYLRIMIHFHGDMYCKYYHL